MKAFGVFFLLAFQVHVAAQPVRIDEASDAFYNLDFDQALVGYERASAASPATSELHNHVAHALLYRELFRNGALESQLVSGNNSFLRRLKMEPSAEVENRFFSEIDKAIALGQARVAKNARDTAALHSLAVSYALRANYGFLVRKTWVASLGDSTRARRFDADVTAIEPDNYDAQMLQGVYDYIVGSLPWTWRALGVVAGFHGDKERGLRTLEAVARKGRENRIDAQMTLCALYRREGQTARAIPMALDFIARFPRNYLLRFELAQMYGALGRRAEALAVLNDVARRKRDNVPGFGRIPWEKIYFETGNLEFWFNDLDAAIDNLKKVTATAEQLREIDLNTGVLALMRQGQIYDLRNRHDLAVAAYRQAIQFAPEAEAAHESQRYISSPYRRPSKA